MKTDITTKLLLGALTVGVWGLLLKPTVQPVQAQGPAESHASPALQIGSNIYVAAPSSQSGRVYRFKGELGRPVLIGEYGPNVKASD